MKVKVGEETHDGLDQPIMVILTKEDKLAISHMPPEATRYAVYPDHWSVEEAMGWMEDIEDASTEKFKKSRFEQVISLEPQAGN